MEDDFGGSVPLTAEQPVSGLDDIQQLRQEVLNEKLSPHLLPHKLALLQRVRSCVDAQDEAIEELEGDPANLLAVQMYQQEKARVTWLIKEYLRVRLRKLERHVVAYMKDLKDEEEAAEESGLLSEPEKAFLEQYFLALGRHYRTMVLSQLPDDYQSLVKSHKDAEEEDMVDRPALDRHVFCRVLQDVGRVRVSEDGLELDFSAGDLYVVRFDFIADLLARGQVALV